MSNLRIMLLASFVSLTGAVVHAQPPPAAPPARLRPPPAIKPDARTGEILAARKAVLDKVTPVTDEMLKNPPPSEWLQWRRTYDSHGFSPLAQINKANVANLRPAWTWSLPPGTTETTPLVHDGVLFIFGNGDRVQALDAAKGDLLWEYVRPPSPGAAASGQGAIKRNIAIYGDKLYIGMSDGHLITLDVKTGKVIWDKAVADNAAKIQMSSGPLIVNGKVIQGMTSCGSTQPGGCYVVGLDAQTGDQLWRFNTLARPGEPGGETWNSLPLERRNGGSVWTTGSYDPELNLVYIGVGNTYNWQDLMQGPNPGAKPSKGTTNEGLYLNSTLALNPETGKLQWHFQHIAGEPWDLDFAFERQIVDVNVNGKPERLVVTTGKTVLTDAVDARTGKWVFTKDQGVQNVVSAIDPKTGRKTLSAAALPDLTGQRYNLQCPAGYGAKNWPANAYNATTKILYISISEVCGESVPRLYTPENPYKGGGQETRMARYQPGSDGNIGRVDAVNLETQKTVWSTRQRASQTSAVLATAGGLVFVGDADRWFKAYDDATGKVLWQMRLNDAINAFPISYSVGGKQYIAVPAGFGGPRIANLHQLTTEIETPRGGSAALWVFEVPEANGQ